MTYARYIGRVGALAVALGIGTAIGQGCAVASADDSGGASSKPATHAGVGGHNPQGRQSTAAAAARSRQAGPAAQRVAVADRLARPARMVSNPAPDLPGSPEPTNPLDTALLAWSRRLERSAAVPRTNQAPTAVNDSGFATAEDTVKTITAAQLLGNDTDPNAGDKLSLASVSGATNGTVALNGDGSVKFTPTANYSGAASFTYKVKDAAGAVSANNATVSITVTPVNDAPRGVADGPFTVTKNTPLTLTAAQLVGNDIDPDTAYGDKLKVNSVGGASNGSIKLNADGSVTFTPKAGYTGDASFIYRVKDVAGATSVTATDAVVTLKVVSITNQAPTAVNDSGFATAEDTVKTITAAQLLGNDTDPNAGDKLSLASVSGATNGTVALNGDGSVKFTPTANYSGAASFTYKVKDAAGAVSANNATVSITVTPVNDAPRGVADGPFTVTKNTPLTLTAAQLVGNDIDPDTAYGDKLKVNSVGGASNGSIKLNADGSVTFTPKAGYTGDASFIYRVKDVAGATSVTATDAVVTLKVVSITNQAPTAVNDSGFATAEDTVKTITAAQLLGNDTDPNAGDKLSLASVSGATNGTVALNGDGSVKFTPTANYSGAASFTYKVKDAAGAVSANNATVSITVTPVNDAPRGVADGPFTVTKNTPLTLTAAQLVGNDIDPDTAYGDKLKVVSWGGGNHVSVVVNGDGSVTVTPETGYTGAASFVYRVGDSAGATSGLSGTDATVSLDIKAAAVGVLTVLEPVTDNYKDTYNTPDNIRENRTYLQIGAIKANGVTYTLTNPPPNGKIETGFTQLAVQGSDGSSGFVTLVPADSNVVTSLRRDYVTAYHPKGSFGPLLVVNTAQLKTAPIKIDLVLTVKNAEVARATLEYRYEDAIYNAPKSNIEYNGPGGRWYVAGTGAPLNWETAGAP